MNMSLIYFLIALVILAYLYSLYSSLIKTKNRLKEASSDVDVQLKKRYDLIPNILNMAAKFMAHEKDLFSDIVRLRNSAIEKDFVSHPKEKMALDSELNAKLKSLWINVENYPDLKSNQTMVQAMQTFHETEENIAAARRFYNSALTELKNAVEIFPSSLIAKLIGIKADRPFFEAEAQEKQRIDVKEYFK